MSRWPRPSERAARSEGYRQRLQEAEAHLQTVQAKVAMDRWQRAVDAASDKWPGDPEQISLDEWRASCLAKGAERGIGSAEWVRHNAQVSRRAAVRHPIKWARNRLAVRFILRDLNDY